MTPEYLRELANLADPQEQWRLSCFAQLALPPHLREQLDIGIALRRHAHHVEQLNGLLGTNQSLLISPLSPNGTASLLVPMPEQHLRLLEKHKNLQPRG